MTNRAIVDITRGITINPTPVFITAGIYHNPTLGLISLSADGTSWMTITDKNLGATQVYNDGDVLSESNCGKYYQWGNNYGFSRTGSVITSSTRVDATNYGPYYYNNVFITGSRDWNGVINYNLRGNAANTNEARKGSCDEGFHIPSNNDWTNLANTWRTLYGGTGAANFLKFLKIPRAGYRDYGTSNVSNQGSSANYWSSTPYSDYEDGRSYLFLIDQYNGFYPDEKYPRCDGYSIRPFKNTFVAPDSSWTTLYQGTGNAGIFHNPTDGIISISSDGINWITIADKNLGATQIWNDGDTLSETNCGGYYQWGNNYMFPFTGSITTSPTQVNAQNYGPYYNNDKFIGSSKWDSSRNANLWGGVVNTNKAMQGPCDNGYHISTENEGLILKNILRALNIDTSNGNCMKTYLKMPFAGNRNSESSDVYYQGTDAYYWSSTAYSADDSYHLLFNSTRLEPLNRNRRSFGFSIRPFKNESVIPDSSWTRLY